MLVSADPSDHVAVLFYDPTTYIATYTVNSSGDLTTQSTTENMPTGDGITPDVMAMSPSGTLLAVGGYGGLQVFHFNGSEPATNYTGLLTTDYIGWLAWDNHNHLYALAAGGSDDPNIIENLYVWTITPTSVTEAPGSPYPIPDPQGFAVLSK